MAKTAKAKSKATTTTRKKTTKRPASTTKRMSTKKRAKSSAAAKQDFFEFRITEQTVYWLIFGAAAILFTIWIYTLDLRVRELYDQVDRNNMNSDPTLEIQAIKARQAS